MGDSRKRLRDFPDAVRFEIGQALYQVEIVSDYRGDTYRGIYTTRLKSFI
jgi:phage-related protein